MIHFKRRAKAAIATIVDLAVAPFGCEVYVVATAGLPGIDGFCIWRLPAGARRARRLKPRP